MCFAYWLLLVIAAESTESAVRRGRRMGIGSGYRSWGTRNMEDFLPFSVWRV